MENIFSSVQEKKCLLNFCATYRHIKRPHSEQDYIEMHSTFLAPGIHHLEVENISSGRNLMSVFLATFKNFHETGCLTMSSEPLPHFVVDIFDELYINTYDPWSIEKFFLEDFSCDFLWIEATESLQSSQLFSLFNSTISHYRIDQHMPILLLTYDSV